MGIACAYEIEKKGFGSKDPDMEACHEPEPGERVLGVTLQTDSTAAGHDTWVAGDANISPQRGVVSAVCCEIPKGSDCNASKHMPAAAVTTPGDDTQRHDSADSLEPDPKSSSRVCEAP